MIEETPECGTLRICGATGTPKADLYSDNDLYAIVVWNDKEIGRTRCIRDDNSPTWDESFDLRVFPGVNTLRVELWEQDKFPDIGEATADINGRDEFMGHAILEGASSSKLPREAKGFELTGKDEPGDRKAGRSMQNASGNGLGVLTVCYTPTPQTPVSKRRPHRNKTRSSALLPAQTLMKEQLLDTRRLDFTFCGLDSCKGIAAVAAKYAIPVWTSTSTKHAKKCLQDHFRGAIAEHANKSPKATAANEAEATEAMPVFQSPRRHNAARSEAPLTARCVAPPERALNTAHRSPRTERAKGTGGKTARGPRTRRVGNEAEEPNCM